VGKPTKQPKNANAQKKHEKEVQPIMRTSQALVLAVLLMLAALPLAAEAPEGVVNINTATAEQIAYLPGVGPKTAERIVAFREESGGFKKPTDLMQVKGIGDKTFERLSPYITTEGKTTLSSNIRTPRKAKKPSTPAQQ
jgi:competence protein ComEA